MKSKIKEGGLFCGKRNRVVW